MKLQYSSSAPTVTAGETIQGQCDVNGNLKVTIPSGSVTVEVGNKSNNGGVPGSTNLGTLPAVANAAAPTYTETNQVALSTDLAGNLRVITPTGGSAEQIQGNVASGATDTGNPVKIGGVNMTTLPTFSDTQRGDLQMGTRGSLHTEIYAPNSSTAISGVVNNVDAVAVSSIVSSLKVQSAGQVFNGTSYDRQRSVIDATNSIGTGITAVGMLAQFDDVSPTSITENQFGNVRMSALRELYVLDRPVTGTALTTYSVHLTSNATTTPTSSTAYISSITISNEVGGTTSTITIQDKQGTPLKLVNGIATTALTTAPTVINFQTPVKMVSGIDVITAGAVAATVDVWINYYQ